MRELQPAEEQEPSGAGSGRGSSGTMAGADPRGTKRNVSKLLVRYARTRKKGTKWERSGY